MGHKKGDPKQKAFAAWMKDNYIIRTTGMCPWGCGAKISNGGDHLIRHLNICTGPRKRAN